MIGEDELDAVDGTIPQADDLWGRSPRGIQRPDQDGFGARQPACAASQQAAADQKPREDESKEEPNGAARHNGLLRWQRKDTGAFYTPWAG
jgi:hypothetical protein